MSLNGGLELPWIKHYDRRALPEESYLVWAAVNFLTYGGYSEPSGSALPPKKTDPMIELESDEGKGSNTLARRAIRRIRN